MTTTPPQEALEPAPLDSAAPVTSEPLQVVRPAWSDGWAHVRLWGVLSIGLTLDLTTKHLAFQRFGQHEGMPVLPGLIEFQIMLNKGALFGIGQGMTEVFLVASVFALLLVAWMFLQSAARQWWLHIALGGIVAGAIGNMVDRATVRLLHDQGQRADGRWVYVSKQQQADGSTLFVEYPRAQPGLPIVRPPADAEREAGFVRDFLKIPTKIWGEQDLWPWVFNVADMLLVGGVSVLGIHLLFERRERPAGVTAAASGSSA